MSKKKRIDLRVPIPVDQVLDAMVATGLFKNRDEAVEFAIRAALLPDALAELRRTESK